MKFKIISLVEIELLNAADPKKLINMTTNYMI